MATRLPRRVPTWVHPHDIAAATPSINTVPQSEVFKVGYTEPWPLDREWIGPPLDTLRIGKSLWSKTNVITFVSTVQGVPVPQFRMDLPIETPREDAHQIAETYMQVLNLRRSTLGDK